MKELLFTKKKKSFTDRFMDNERTTIDNLGIKLYQDYDNKPNHTEFNQGVSIAQSVDHTPYEQLPSQWQLLFGEKMEVNSKSLFTPPPLFMENQKNIFGTSICSSISSDLATILLQQSQAFYESQKQSAPKEKSAAAFEISHQQRMLEKSHTHIKGFWQSYIDLCTISDKIRSSMLLYLQG